jgi:broad specificity phosphatase PhoE
VWPRWRVYLSVFEYAAGAPGSMQHHGSIRRPWMESYGASDDPESDGGPGIESFTDDMGRARSVLRKLYGRTGTITVFGHGRFMQVVRASKRMDLMDILLP